MKIAVVIPTYKRLKKLERCLKSLEAQTYKNFWVNVYADNNDQESFEISSKWRNSLDIISTQMSSQSFVIGCWNDFFSSTFICPGVKGMRDFDAVAWIVDDVELYPNYLEELVKAMLYNFPDLDGVIGAKQECPGREDYTYKDFGQILIGKKFIERYKDVDYQVCCPFYSHFHQDHELWEYAKSMNKFIKCETAVLKHYHPAFLPNEVDLTHPLVRGEVKRKDDAIFRDRQARGLIWGKSWIK